MTTFQAGDKATFNKDYGRKYTYDILSVLDVNGVEYVVHKNADFGALAEVYVKKADQFTKVAPKWEVGKTYVFSKVGKTQYDCLHVEPSGVAVVAVRNSLGRMISTYIVSVTDRENYLEAGEDS